MLKSLTVSNPTPLVMTCALHGCFNDMKHRKCHLLCKFVLFICIPVLLLFLPCSPLQLSPRCRWILNLRFRKVDRGWFCLICSVDGWFWTTKAFWFCTFRAKLIEEKSRLEISSLGKGKSPTTCQLSETPPNQLNCNIRDPLLRITRSWPRNRNPKRERQREERWKRISEKCYWSF